MNSIPTSLNYKFYWILISSLILHVFLLSFVNFPKGEKQPVEKIFEVQLQETIVQPPPPTPAPPAEPKKQPKKQPEKQPIKQQQQKRIPPKQTQYIKKKKILQPQQPSIIKAEQTQKKLKIDLPQKKIKIDLVQPSAKDIKKKVNLLDKPLPTVKPVSKPSLAKPLASPMENIEVTTENNGFLDSEVKMPVTLNQPSKIQIKEQKTKGKTRLSGASANQITGVSANQIKAGEELGEIKAKEIKAKEIKQTADKYEVKTVPSNNDADNPIKSTTSINDLKIEGEVSLRQLIYQPKIPNLDIDKDLTISLKFSVLPSGVVDQIIPFKKADPDLEKLAMGLLLQYRFEPLFGDKEIQYGIIHFTIKRSN